MPSRLTTIGERFLPARIRQERVEERLASQQKAEAEAAHVLRAEKIAARRAALLAQDPDLREISGPEQSYFGRRVHTIVDTDARSRNFALVTDALEHAGLDYFLVPGRSPKRHVVGVRFADRKAFLAALRDLYADTALYALKPSSDRWPADVALYADGALPTALKRQDTIRFGEILLGPDDQVLADLTQGCDVEFWRDGEDLVAAATEPKTAERLAALRVQAPHDVLAGALVAPRPNAVADVLPADALVPATRSIAGRSHPTWDAFRQQRIDATDFPIDVVYTWVDGDDPKLAAVREAHRPTPGKASRINTRETGTSRYTSRDELKYSLRSLQMYAPFIRNVFIVTDGQTPGWLNTAAAGVQVVDHKDIFSDPTALPVFNSHAIGTQLHHIDGLSERYLYFNDDVFLGRPITPGHFFHSNGIAKLPFSPAQLGLGAPHPDEPAPNSAGKNVRTLIQDTHGRFTVNKFMHTPHPQIQSVMRDLEKLFPEDLDRTSRSKFRAVTDIATAASLHHHHAYLTGRAVAGTYKLRYVDVALPDAQEKMTALARDRAFDFFCLNDVNTPADHQDRIAEEVHSFLEAYFPLPSRWEVG
ncbi:stealth family protein [Streptomyces luteolus]|uniref:Stealth family protein n=1 Tax=Streptomyces luteolus TaxID=3043615 RepID=A0ABT6T5L1_9ACTN|nr:stealth family protein [Streptomyces sp. B-S-A12]MDI3422695.1 stealth family protein [Streptomyces sp. B-S-A12]